MAYGSARELEYQLSLVNRLGFQGDPDFDTVSKAALETCKVLNGLIRALKQRDWGDAMPENPWGDLPKD